MSGADVTNDARVEYLLRLGDSSLVLSQRLGEWVGHAPTLEEELALANLALDCVGQARLLLSYAAQLEGEGRDEDELAYLREEGEFRNVNLVEQANGDFAVTIVRQCLFDAWQLLVFDALRDSADEQLAAIAEKSLRESRYHWRFSRGWLVRLGDGTRESRQRTQAGLDLLWKFTAELFAPDPLDQLMVGAGIGVDLQALQPAWDELVDRALAEAGLGRPAQTPHRWFGKRGEHTEALGLLLAEMQSLHRAHPGVQW